MKVFKLEKFLHNKDATKDVMNSLKRGSIIIYPTDTIYGIGCDIRNQSSVREIYNAKSRPEKKQFSIIIPNLGWLDQNTKITEKQKKVLSYLLPGPYTVILKANSRTPKSAVSKEGTIGIRIPKHPFTDIIRENKILLISTSVNISGRPSVISIENIPEQIKMVTNYAIDAGPLDNPPSTVIDMTGEKPGVINRGSL